MLTVAPRRLNQRSMPKHSMTIAARQMRSSPSRKMQYLKSTMTRPTPSGRWWDLTASLALRQRTTSRLQVKPNRSPHRQHCHHRLPEEMWSLNSLQILLRQSRQPVLDQQLQSRESCTRSPPRQIQHRLVVQAYHLEDHNLRQKTRKRTRQHRPFLDVRLLNSFLLFRNTRQLEVPNLQE